MTATQTAQLSVLKIKVQERKVPDGFGGRNARANWRDYNEAPRVYFWFKGETVIDHLFNRRNEPYRLVKKQILDRVLREMKVECTKIRWSQYAGCKMCPCSPGFVLENGTIKHNGKVTRHFDVFLYLRFVEQ